MHVLAENLGVLAASDAEFVEDVQHGAAAESVEPPFIASLDQCTDQAVDDHDLVHKDDPEDGRPGHAGGQQEVEKEHGGGKKPVVPEDRKISVQCSSVRSPRYFSK